MSSVPKAGSTSRADALAWVMRAELSLLYKGPGVDARPGSLLMTLRGVKEAFGFTEDQLAASRRSFAEQVTPRGAQPYELAHSMGDISTGRHPSYPVGKEVLEAALLADANRGPNGTIVKPTMLASEVNRKVEAILDRADSRDPDRMIRQLETVRKESGMDRGAFEKLMRDRVAELKEKYPEGHSMRAAVDRYAGNVDRYIDQGKTEVAAAAGAAADTAARQAMERKVADIAAREAEMKADRVEGKPVDPEALKKLRAEIAGLSPEEQRALTAAREQAAKETGLKVDGKPMTLAQYQAQRGEVKLEGAAAQPERVAARPDPAADKPKDIKAAVVPEVKAALKGMNPETLAGIRKTFGTPEVVAAAATGGVARGPVVHAV